MADKEKTIHKMRCIQTADNIFGITVPYELGRKYAGAFFKVTEYSDGRLMLQSGAKR
jgi:hypothetical protein